MTGGWAQVRSCLAAGPASLDLRPPGLGQRQAADRAAEFEAEWLRHIPQQDQRQLED